MKATQTLQVPALSYKPQVNNYLIKGIIYLTSEKFCTFVSVIAALIEYIGMILDNERVIAYGGIVFLIGSIPWAIRQTFRDVRREKLGLNNDKW